MADWVLIPYLKAMLAVNRRRPGAARKAVGGDWVQPPYRGRTHLAAHDRKKEAWMNGRRPE